MSGKGISTKKTAALVPLFVYGTLKRNFPLHEWVEDQQFVGQGEILDHTLVSLGAYPALVSVEGINSTYAVVGELFMLDPVRFNQLRKMEERVGYQTVDVDVHLTNSVTSAKAFVFTTLLEGKVKWEQQRLPKQTKGRAQMYPGQVVAVSNAPLI